MLFPSLGVWSRHPHLDIAQYQLGDGLKLHVRSTFVNLPDLRIAIILLSGIVFRVAVAAVKLDHLRRDVLGYLRGEQLGHSRLLYEVHTSILHPRAVVNHQPRCFELRSNLRDLKLHALKRCYRLGELARIPSLFSFLPTVKPSNSRSTIKAVIPR